MKEILFILLRSVFLLGFIQFHALGEVDLNMKWIKRTETVQALSISPTGTVSVAVPDWGKWKCYMYGGNDFCKGYWVLKIGDKYTGGCPTTVTVNTGTTMSYMVAQINSNMMKPCTFPYYDFSGGEDICLRLETYGYYSDLQGGILGPSFLTYGSCYRGGNGDGQGGELKPPVEPVTCQINNQNIVIQHPVLNQDKLDGNYKEKSFNISCTRKNSVELILSGLDASGRLALTGTKNLYSKLKINNSPAGKKVIINDVGNEGSDVLISSELQRNGDVLGGEYSASAVLMMTLL